jgi:hypothetical protein
MALYNKRMTDNLFGTYDIRGSESDGLTIECAWNIGKAMADWLPQDGQVAVVYVPTQKHLAAAIVEGLRLQGRDVIDGGNGDATSVKAYIRTSALAGGVVVGYDDTQKVATIELYRDEAVRIDQEGGLKELCESVGTGNFVPALEKGQLTHLT